AQDGLENFPLEAIAAIFQSRRPGGCLNKGIPIVVVGQVQLAALYPSEAVCICTVQIFFLALEDDRRTVWGVGTAAKLQKIVCKIRPDFPAKCFAQRENLI